MRRVVLSLAALFALVATGRSEPLALKQVAADAKWIMHLDVDALRSSIVVNKAYKMCMEMHKEAAQHMDKLPGMIGMDPRKDLHGITVYGKELDKRKGVLILHADVNQQLLKEKAAKAPEHKVTKNGDYQLHSWVMKSRHGTQTIVGAFFKPNILVFGVSSDAVAAALGVLAGKSPGIAEGRSPLAGRTLPGSVFVARAAAIDAKTRCPVLKQCDSFRVAMGENAGQSFYRARLNMKSTESVGQVRAIVEGFRAMVLLNKSIAPDAVKLIDGLKLTSEGTTLTIAWNAKADDVWTAIEKAAKKFEERRRKGGACPIHGDTHKGQPCPQKPKANQAEEF
jgi:hypothetical protein